jgi:hypothetical protein
VLIPSRLAISALRSPDAARETGAGRGERCRP